MVKKKRAPEPMPASKRTKTMGLPDDDMFLLLGRDVFLLVLQMLDPTDMSQLAQASLVLETWMPYRIVVRNAILAGGNSKKNVKTLIGLVHEQKVHMPSVSRILTVSSKGQKCCDMCGSLTKTPLLKSDFGLFLCKIGDQCNSTISIRCNTIDKIDRWAKFKYNGGGMRSQKWGILTRPVVDKETNESIGPILTYRDLCTMLVSCDPKIKMREPHVGPPYYDTTYPPVKLEVLREYVQKLPRAASNPILLDNIQRTIEEACIEDE